MKKGRSTFALEWVPDGRLFAVGGFDAPYSALTTVEMLHCPWDTEEPVNSQWQFVEPMNYARACLALAYFEGKIIAAGGEHKSVECFTLPSGKLQKGQWVIIRPMNYAKKVCGILPFGEDLLFVGMCIIGCLFSGRLFRPKEFSYMLFNLNTSSFSVKKGSDK